jgi:hypothetical protein
VSSEQLNNRSSKDVKKIFYSFPVTTIRYLKKGGEKMEKTKLEMDFLDGYNKRLRISIDEPMEELLQSEIESAMDSIITHNIFQSNGMDLVSREGARIIKTTVNEMEF